MNKMGVAKNQIEAALFHKISQLVKLKYYNEKRAIIL